jgi:transcriptional regulator with XRE-family HTH domain
MNMGEIIKHLRETKDLSQEELGKLVGVNRAAVSKWEKGRVENLKITTIKNLCSVFNCTPCELMGWEEEFNKQCQLSNEVNLIEKIQLQYGKDSVELLNYFNKLNSVGKEKAIENTLDLTAIPKYTMVEKRDVKVL